ncbi:response regulator [Pseudomonas sp. Fig-3]|uniref:histidine kinase n=1 Tax=Pseudomonas rhizophila TaxID=2045200 RepID=A0ABN5JWW6_9PSED|nr:MULTISPECIES: ATP-binding protein [Pseudomonas]AVU77217.1 hybrid sensor histidine kinase/response regulator [Pseudomonas rhizophila]MDD2033798.1 ATP-binding protein [Pseudomonas sp. 39167]MDR8386022.1 ATP-binding protein [Pseudomonas sp. JL2]MEA1028162.1 ATP-binding protein [Pseudomonas sp. N-137]QKJ35400.1 PAS domain-containing protein [Pseudomonas sp. MPDS]
MQFLSQNHGCPGWGGEMAGRIRSFDWSQTELGAIEHWSASLRSAVQVLLASPLPMVMLWGRQGFMIYNDAYAEFAGGRHPYLLGCAVELGWPEVAEFNRHVLDVCLAGGTLSYRSKELVLLRNGKPEDVWMDLYYSPVPDDDQSPGGVLAIVVETTELVLTERARQEAERSYRAVNERIQLALSAGPLLGSFVWDIQNDTLSGDERFSRTFNYPPDTPLDALPVEIARQNIHPDDLEEVNRRVELTLRTGTPYNAEYRVRRLGGDYLWVLASGRCEFDTLGRPLRFPGVLIDINERKAAEASLLKFTRDLEQRVAEEVHARLTAEEQLRQSQKLEAIGGLTGGVAHDFNNLLQVIAGNLHLLARHEPHNANVQRRVSASIEAVERGAKLSSQLLAFARRQPLSPAVYNPRRIFDGLGELLQRALGETIQIEVTLPAEPWCIHVDRNQLENALLNLAINARDAMCGEGTIGLIGENIVLDESSCAGKDIPAGDYVRLSVIDRGAGMPPDVLDHVFEPFFTTKTDGQGTGLGLSMVFGFVKQSGGHIEITSDVGEGTRAQMYFPRSRQPETGEEAPHSPLLTGGQETILVVEDNEEVRSASVELLEQSGYRTLTAANADAAMALLLEGASVDLIFTDVVMPGLIKSSDLAAWARVQTPPMPILFTSGHTRDIISRNHQLSPDTHLLSKPYGPDALITMVRTVLGS